MLIFFTVKNRKKVGPQPPHQLHFYDDMELEERPRRRMQQRMKDEDIECFEEVTAKEDDRPGCNEQKAFAPHQLPNPNQPPYDLSLHQEAVRVFQNNAKSRHHSDRTRDRNDIIMNNRYVVELDTYL